MENSPQKPLPLVKTPWEDNNNSIWLASKVSLCRNVEKFHFPSKLTPDRGKQVAALLGQELLNQELLKNPVLYPADEVSSLDKELLLEHFVSTDNYTETPSGGFVLDNTGTFLGTLNVGNHLQLELLDFQGEIENTWSRLVRLDSKIGNKLAYAYSHKFGFLTSDFSLCGTALSVSIFLQLSALIHTQQIDGMLDTHADESIFITGIQGNPTEIIGDIVVIQNNFTLGVTEENILASLRTFITKILVEEGRCRQSIQMTQDSLMKDRVSRAYGILIHSYQIEAIEALNALSILKLGVEFGWVKGVSGLALNRLFFNCRRAHLLRVLPEKVPLEELPHRRAEYIHQTLREAQLVI